jgi:hypothetical protein
MGVICCAGVIAAAALKCMGGFLQGRLWPRNDEERQKAVEAGYDLEAILYQDDLCKGEQVISSRRRWSQIRLTSCLPTRNARSDRPDVTWPDERCKEDSQEMFCLYWL